MLKSNRVFLQRRNWKMASSSSNSPCAACKFLRRKCQLECVFAPYFPPDQPQKFANVHKVFGASNVTKLLNELHPHQREDAVNSLAYEADMRLRDPVYGCVGVISLLQHQLCKLQMDLTCAKSELSKYQNLGIGNHAALISPPSAVSTVAHGQRNHQPAFNFARDQPHSLYHDQFFPRDQQQQQMMLRRSFDGGSNYDGLLSVNVTASIGNLSHQFQQSRAAAGDDRRGTLDHS
ncbi:protein ASYMMETRIC LEAVES 2 isoform X1 [Benincasa hispida]|uniref:protein ASYMMETRIC LEAVES 2 isoform X1 n=2 Tax=Benincasa hispida TaxID=102211 RepID=UPI0018FF860E|nr:protein ASYMMETRIC LEAVES 2 isoform X1 [Benincasa hispida]